MENNKYFYILNKTSNNETHHFAHVENHLGEIIIKLHFSKDSKELGHYYMNDPEDLSGLLEYLIHNQMISDFSTLVLKD